MIQFFFRENETQRKYLGLRSLPHWVFYPYHQSLYGRTVYADVITTFSEVHGFPFFIVMGSATRASRTLRY